MLGLRYSSERISWNMMEVSAYLRRALSMSLLLMRKTISLSIQLWPKRMLWVSTRTFTTLIMSSGKLSDVNAPIWQEQFQGTPARRPNFRCASISIHSTFVWMDIKSSFLCSFSSWNLTGYASRCYSIVFITIYCSILKL